jgi:hypothetical protein
MTRSPSTGLLAAAVLATAMCLPSFTYADDPIETAGVVAGVTAGNAVAIPAKIISVGTGFIAGALSFILTGGNADLTAQIWRDVTEGPWMITPAVARRAIGERPELEKRKTGMVETTTPAVMSPEPTSSVPAVPAVPAPAEAPPAQ